MNLFFDLDTSQLVTGAGTRSPLSTLALKRGDNLAIKLVFLSNGQVVELAAGATGVIGIKAAGDYDGDYLAVAESWTKSGTGTSTVYALALDLNTEELADELGVGAAPDKARVAVMFELEFVADGIRTSSQTVNATVNNDVNRGTEGTPSALPDAVDFLEAQGVLPLAGSGAPTLSAAASATLDPAGADNTILVDAVENGTAGNLISVAITTPVQADLSVSVAGNTITVAAGTKHRMLLTYASGPFSGTFELLYIGLDNSGKRIWIFDDGTTEHIITDTTEDTPGSFEVLVSSSNGVDEAEAETADGYFWPDEASGSLVATVGDVAPTIAASTPTALQVDLAIKASTAASALILVDAEAVTSGAGAVAALSAVTLTGGADTTPGIIGSERVDSSFLYKVVAIQDGAPVWRKIAHQAL